MEDYYNSDDRKENFLEALKRLSDPASSGGEIAADDLKLCADYLFHSHAAGVYTLHRGPSKDPLQLTLSFCPETDLEAKIAIYSSSVLVAGKSLDYFPIPDNLEAESSFKMLSPFEITSGVDRYELYADTITLKDVKILLKDFKDGLKKNLTSDDDRGLVDDLPFTQLKTEDAQVAPVLHR